MTMPDEAATSLGSGMHDIVRAGNIGLRLPLLPTRQAEGEPCLFIPDKWSVEIVRMGKAPLARPRPLPQHTMKVGGRSISGHVLHIPKGKSVVLGRDPHPKDEREQDADQICVKMLRIGAETSRVSSAVLSLVRLTVKDRDSVYALNGHYSKGRNRTSPKLSPFIRDSQGELVKHLNGPHVSKELSPGMDIVLGYLLDGIDLPRTYAEPNERIHYLEDLVDSQAEFRLDSTPSPAARASQPCLALTQADARALQLTCSTRDQPAVVLGVVKAGKSNVAALQFQMDAVLARTARHGCYELLVGSDLAALKEAAMRRGIAADLAVVSERGLLPVHAVFRVSPGGEIQVEPLLRSPIFTAEGSAVQARVISSLETIKRGSLMLLGSKFRTKLFSRRAETVPAVMPTRATTAHAPAGEGRAPHRPSPPRARANETLMKPRRTWFQRLASVFVGH